MISANDLLIGVNEKIYSCEYIDTGWERNIIFYEYSLYLADKKRKY